MSNNPYEDDRPFMLLADGPEPHTYHATRAEAIAYAKKLQAEGHAESWELYDEDDRQCARDWPRCSWS